MSPDHDHAALRPLTHASEIRVIELGLRAAMGSPALPSASARSKAATASPCQVIDNLEPFGAEFLHSYRLRGAGMEALLVFRDVPMGNDAAYPRGGSGPRRHRGHFAWTRHFDGAKVGWPRDLQIFHVLRIEQMMNNART